MKIAVLCLPGIGDSLMATPLIRQLRRRYPRATIDVICMFSGVAYCFKNNPYISHVYQLSLYNVSLFRGLWEIFLMRRNNSYDISLLAFPAYRREYHIVQFLLGAKKRISHLFSKGFWKEYNFLDNVRIPVDEHAHNVTNNMNLLYALNIEWDKKKTLSYDLKLDENDIFFGNDFIKKLHWNSKNIIAIHPGSINSAAGVYKRWPEKKFALLVNKLLQMKKHVLIFVGPFEKDLGLKIIQNVKKSKNCVLVQNTSFGQSLGILKRVRLLISNDNGFAHLANALKVKEIVLFGPTNPLWCSPINKKYATIIRKATFTPWFRNDMKVTHPPQGIHSGMNAISVEDVLEKIRL